MGGENGPKGVPSHAAWLLEVPIRLAPRSPLESKALRRAAPWESPKDQAGAYRARPDCVLSVAFDFASQSGTEVRHRRMTSPAVR